MPKYIQDPDAVLDYTVDWTKQLVGDDYIVAAEFSTEDGLSVLSSNLTDSTVDETENAAATVWLLGGVAGQTYNVTCHISTAGGRQDDRTFKISVREK